MFWKEAEKKVATSGFPQTNEPIIKEPGRVGTTTNLGACTGSEDKLQLHNCKGWQIFSSLPQNACSPHQKRTSRHIPGSFCDSLWSLGARWSCAGQSGAGCRWFLPLRVKVEIKLNNFSLSLQSHVYCNLAGKAHNTPSWQLAVGQCHLSH